MRAVVFTLGCKVNDVESGSLIRGLEEMGYSVSRYLEDGADLYIINTCAVTAEAERKSRQTVGKAVKAGKFALPTFIFKNRCYIYIESILRCTLTTIK